MLAWVRDTTVRSAGCVGSFDIVRREPCQGTRSVTRSVGLFPEVSIRGLEADGRRRTKRIGFCMLYMYTGIHPHENPPREPTGHPSHGYYTALKTEAGRGTPHHCCPERKKKKSMENEKEKEMRDNAQRGRNPQFALVGLLRRGSRNQTLQSSRRLSSHMRAPL